MARIEPLNKRQTDQDTKELLEIVERQFGMIPNLFATIAHYPKALKPLMELYAAISGESTIAPSLQEMANLETSRINNCNYCLTHHTRTAKIAGIKDGQLKAWQAGQIKDAFSDKEQAVIEYAHHVTLNAENISEGLFKRLRSYFSDKEIVNLTLIIGLMNLFNRVNGALKIELENAKGGV